MCHGYNIDVNETTELIHHIYNSTMTDHLEEIINLIVSEDQNQIYKGYQSLIEYLKTHTVEDKQIVYNIFEYIVFHLDYNVLVENLNNINNNNNNNSNTSTNSNNNNNDSMVVIIEDDLYTMTTSLNFELIVKVLEAWSCSLDYLEGSQEDIGLLERAIKSVVTRYIGNKNPMLSEAVDTIVQGLIKTSYASDVVLDGLSQSIVDCDWKKRWHSLVLLSMAVTTSSIRLSEKIISQRAEMVRDIVSLVNDPNRRVGEQSLQLLELLYTEDGSDEFIHQFILNDITLDNQVKQSIFERLGIQVKFVDEDGHDIEQQPHLQQHQQSDQYESQNNNSFNNNNNNNNNMFLNNHSYDHSYNYNNRSVESVTSAFSSSSTFSTHSSFDSGIKTSSKPIKQQQQQQQQMDPFGLTLMNNGINEREFERRTMDIIDKLSSSSVDWDIKVNNLLKFQALLGEGVKDLSNFTSLFHKILDPLLTLTKDIRSQLLKEACNTVTTIAQQLGHSFDPYADRFIQVLLKNVIVTIQAIAEASDKCIKNIIASSYSTKILPRFTESLVGGKSAVLRTRCSEYIHLMLQHIPKESLDSKLVLVEPAIKAGLVDSNPDVRATCRQSFLLYASNWPTKANELYKHFDPNTKKAIDKERQSSYQPQQQQQQQQKVTTPSTLKYNNNNVNSINNNLHKNSPKKRLQSSQNINSSSNNNNNNNMNPKKQMKTMMDQENGYGQLSSSSRNQTIPSRSVLSSLPTNSNSPSTTSSSIATAAKLGMSSLTLSTTSNSSSCSSNSSNSSLTDKRAEFINRIIQSNNNNSVPTNNNGQMLLNNVYSPKLTSITNLQPTRIPISNPTVTLTPQQHHNHHQHQHHQQLYTSTSSLSSVPTTNTTTTTSAATPSQQKEIKNYVEDLIKGKRQASHLLLPLSNGLSPTVAKAPTSRPKSVHFSNELRIDDLS
ncbi:CLIP-associating protein [Cavenderia fasciculata]|uniref:CLIP-associating protein n=1 Tax=Cavenderia fasciculata TaxID=261658 RepID=F4Q0T4_CACFS|nr:CLIP-associating protein [Cavenderia fasciculata]EGG18435.1 CLIP-associating protein [Cavenderia fasciculata]|eukprot:XP_004366339.1 CLIP-associating protein [Cavenderia fasciculata]